MIFFAPSFMGAGFAVRVTPREPPAARGLHSFFFQLNVSAFCG